MKEPKQERSGRLKGPIPNAPIPVVTIPITKVDAALIAADPSSLRLWVRRADGVPVAIKPHWANHEGIPVVVDWVRRVDVEEGHVVFAEWREDRLEDLRKEFPR
jgi:hypothetical protein